MSIYKRLISTGAAAVCTADTLDIFGDSSCVALYGLNYDASDASGNYDGTPTNVDFNAPGYIDYAASFNGSSGYVNLGTGLSGLSGILNQKVSQSVSFWMNTSFTGISGNSVIYSVYYGIGVSLNVYYFADGTLHFFTRYSGNVTSFTTTQTFNDGQWHHIAVSIDVPNLERKVYIDNTLESTQTLSSSAHGGSGNDVGVALGTNANFNTQYYKGKLDQVRIFNKAISSSEVTTLYGEVACEYTCTTDTNGFPVSASSDLVAYYKLDNDATDDTGTYDGTATNVTYDGGRYGSAAVFNGSSSYIDLGQRILGGTHSASAWVNSSTTGVRQTIIGNAYDGSTYGLSFFIGNDNKLALQWSHSNSWIDVVDSTANRVNDGDWHHVAYFISAGSQKIYVDGSEVASGTTSSTAQNNTTAPTIIGRNWNASGYFNGSIDQVRIYTKALSSTEVSSLYEDEHQCYITVDSTDPFGDSSNLALYEFENNANDSTGSYNGTASNVTYSTDSIIGTYAGSFNGSSSYVNIGDPAALRLLGSYSISFWIKFNSTSGFQRIINKDNADDYSGGYAIFANGTTFEMVHSNGSYNGFAVTNAFTSGVWYNFAVIFNSSNNSLKGYKNGIEIVSTSTSGSLTNSGDNLFFGTFGQSSPISQWLNGSLDQVRIFNTALDGDKVWKLYAEGAKG